MKVYIDLGVMNGDTIEWFYETYPDWKDYKIYGFDPAIRYQPKWDELMAQNPNLKIQGKAAATYDGEIEFTLRPESAPHGSTTHKGKRDWGQGEILKVPCFDFPKWFKQFRGDEVILKINIEGGEYNILEQMLADKTDDIPKKLYVEFHDNKISDPDIEARSKFIRTNLRCDWEEWE